MYFSLASLAAYKYKYAAYDELRKQKTGFIKKKKLYLEDRIIVEGDAEHLDHVGELVEADVRPGQGVPNEELGIPEYGVFEPKNY